MKASPLTDRLPHLFVLLFGAIFGGGLVFVTPPYSVPDELQHFFRAYECSQGKVYGYRRDGACGDDLPASLRASYQAIAGTARRDEEFSVSRDKIHQALAIPLAPRRQQYSTFENTVLYSPVPYLPSATAVWIGRVAGCKPLVLLYVGRMANWICYLALAVAAVRIIPVQKWTLALVAVMPMSMFLASSLSADAMTLALALVAISLAIDLSLGEAPSIGRLSAFAACLLLLALSKQAYISLALLFFIIPRNKFPTRRRWWAAALLVLGLPVAANLAWAFSLRGLYVPFRPFVDPWQQGEWIASHPLNYAATLLKAIYRPTTYLLMIGTFGWLGAHLWKSVCLIYWAALGAAAVLDGGEAAPLAGPTRVGLFSIYVASAAVVATVAYLSSEPIGAKGIEGIQPRYFLPLVPLLLLPIRGGMKVISNRYSRAAVPIFATLTAIVAAAATWATLAMRYYR